MYPGYFASFKFVPSYISYFCLLSSTTIIEIIINAIITISDPGGRRLSRPPQKHLRPARRPLCEGAAARLRRGDRRGGGGQPEALGLRPVDGGEAGPGAGPIRGAAGLRHRPGPGYRGPAGRPPGRRRGGLGAGRRGGRPLPQGKPLAL